MRRGELERLEKFMLPLVLLISKQKDHAQQYVSYMVQTPPRVCCGTRRRMVLENAATQHRARLTGGFGPCLPLHLRGLLHAATSPSVGDGLKPSIGQPRPARSAAGCRALRASRAVGCICEAECRFGVSRHCRDRAQVLTYGSQRRRLPPFGHRSLTQGPPEVGRAE